MTCLICRYFQPLEPPQHKIDREAGKCRSHCGKEWDQHTAINYVKRHQVQGTNVLDGWCRLHTEAKKVTCKHVCADISVRSFFFNPGWGVEPFEADENLYEWACKTLGIIIHGTWRDQAATRINNENEKLRQQLKHAREISASRLRRLQKIKDKPKAEPAPTPVYPHLVAAE